MLGLCDVTIISCIVIQYLLAAIMITATEIGCAKGKGPSAKCKSMCSAVFRKCFKGGGGGAKLSCYLNLPM